MQTQHESIEDYQITVAEDIDFLKLIKILKSNKFEENPSIKKNMSIHCSHLYFLI